MTNNPKGGNSDLELASQINIWQFTTQFPGRQAVLILKERGINDIGEESWMAKRYIDVEVLFQDKYGDCMPIADTPAALLANIDSIKMYALVPRWEYADYIGSEEWCQRKNSYFSTHEKTCAICGSANIVHLHHINYDRLGYESDDDLVPLCSGCHERLHAYIDTYERKIGNLALTWNNATKNISNANGNNELIERFRAKYHDNLEYIFGKLPPILNRHKMKFISIFNKSVIARRGRENSLPFDLLAKTINSKKG